MTGDYRRQLRFRLRIDWFQVSSLEAPSEGLVAGKDQRMDEVDDVAGQPGLHLDLASWCYHDNVEQTPGFRLPLLNRE